MSDGIGVVSHLAIECGATESVALTGTSTGLVVDKYVFGAANYKLLSERQLETFLGSIRGCLKDAQLLAGCAIGLPGLVEEADKEIVKKIALKLWPNLKRIWVGNDLETAMACLPPDDTVKCVINCGTGSSCFGTNGRKSTRIGGFGHVLGDRGSGFEIGLKALRLALKEYEHNDNSLLLDLMFNELDLMTVPDLVDWSLIADKKQIASLAQLVLHEWHNRNPIACQVVEEAVADLVTDASCLLSKLLVNELKADSVTVGLTGSLFSQNSRFANLLKEKFTCLWPRNEINFILVDTSAEGALKMIVSSQNAGLSNGKQGKNGYSADVGETKLQATVVPIATDLSPTERRNQRSMNFDSMSVTSAIELMISEDATIFEKILNHKKGVETLINRIAAAFRSNGRLFYVGAGTSGRLGVLDASECHTTFASPPHWVQGIIAGGEKAFTAPADDAEDSFGGGMKEMSDKNVNDRDVVVGIAACGRTPFVWGSLYMAKKCEAFTALICCNPHLEYRLKPNVVIDVNVGPEVLTGSTRLKCGTATKCILNMLTTIAMAQFGKCYENLMVDMNPINDKLRERALRIVMTICESKEEKVSEEIAKYLLERNNFDISATVTEIKQIC